MDVRCPSCAVEYEFDDAKVTTTGVTVKCTSCGHVFKVKREGAAPALDLPEASAAGGEWRIRQPDGRSFAFKELTTLQKWIVEQKVSRQDEISKTGQTWKRLGDIQELASFFQVVDAARAAQQLAAQASGFASVPPGYGSVPPGMAPPGYPPGAYPPGYPGSLPPGSVPPGSVPPGSMPPGAVPPGYGSYPPGPAGYPPGSLPPGSLPPGSLPPGYGPYGHQPSPSGVPTPAGVATGHYAPGQKQPTLETVFDPGQVPLPDLDASLDVDDPVRQWKRRSRGRRVAVLLVVLLVGGGAGVYFGKPEWALPVTERLGLPPPPGLPPTGPDPLHVAARAALATDTQAALEQAQASLEARLASGAPADLAWAARLRIARARLAEDEAWLLARTARSGEAADRRRAAEEQLAQGYQLVGRALAGGDAPEARLAGADYQAMKGALAEMSADLDAAAAKGAAFQSEARVIELQARLRALREVDEAGRPRAGTAVEAALAAAGLPADDGRVRWARALATAVQTSDAAKVRPLLDEVTRRAPAHTRAPLLLAALEGGLKPTPVGEVPPAPSEEAKPGADDAKGKPPADRKDDDDDDDDDDDEGGKASGASYASLLKKAQRLQSREKCRSALGVYKKAADKKPDAGAPWVGMGWCQLDLDRANQAVGSFKKALAVDGDAAEAHFGLGEAYKALGDTGNAIASYKRYLSMSPTGRDAPVAKRALEQLQ